MCLLNFQNGSLEMQGALLVKPLKNEDIVIPLNVMQLIKLKKSKSEICQSLNDSKDLYFAAIQRLVENGHEISKNDIKMLCEVETVEFDQFRRNISDATLQSESLTNAMLTEIQADYHQNTGIELALEFIKMMVSYYKVRGYLDQSNVPYFDFDDQHFHNATKLIVAERPISNPNHLDVEVNVPPFRCHSRSSDLADMMEPMSCDLPDLEDESDECNSDDECNESGISSTGSDSDDSNNETNRKRRRT